MRSYLFIIFIILFSGLNAHSQKFQSNLSLHLGRAGNNQDAKPKFSYGAGVELGVNISPKFAFLVKPMAMFRGYKDAIYNVSALYLDVPVAFEYTRKSTSKVNWLLGGGVYGGMALAGNYKYENNKTILKFGESATDNRSRLDYGIHGVFGWLGQNGVKWAGQFQAGLKNVIPEARVVPGEKKLILSNFTFYLSIPIAKAKKD